MNRSLFGLFAGLILLVCAIDAQKRRKVSAAPDATKGASAGKGAHPISAFEQVKNAIPGQDYPIHSLDNPPQTTFSCDSANIHYPGYYADPEAGCQLFHYCPMKIEGQPSVAVSFLCPNLTIFNQRVLTCEWFYQIDCNQAVNQYDLANSRLYQTALPLLDD